MNFQEKIKKLSRVYTKEVSSPLESSIIGSINSIKSILDNSIINVKQQDVEGEISLAVGSTVMNLPMSEETMSKIFKYFGLINGCKIKTERFNKLFHFNDYSLEGQILGLVNPNIDSNTNKPNPQIYFSPTSSIDSIRECITHEVFHAVFDLYMYYEQNNNWTQAKLGNKKTTKLILYKHEVLARLWGWNTSMRGYESRDINDVKVSGNKALGVGVETDSEWYNDSCKLAEIIGKGIRIPLYNMIFKDYGGNMQTGSSGYKIYETFCRSLNFFIAEIDSIDALEGFIQLIVLNIIQKSSNTREFFDNFYSFSSPNEVFTKFQERMKEKI